MPQTFAPPPLPPGFLPRSFGRHDPLPPLVALTAGPGFGKTFALHALRSRLDPGVPTIWLTLQPRDATPSRFFARLLVALEHCIPGIQQHVYIDPAADFTVVRDNWLALFDALGSYGTPPLLWVFDDAHHLLPQTVLKGLAPALNQQPETLHILLASRQRLPLPLSRLESAQRAWWLTQDSLAFDLEEATALLAARGLALPDDLPARLQAHQGWPLALSLGGAVPASLAAVHEVLDELLEQQDEATRSVLLGLGLLGQFEAGLAERCLGLEAAAARLDHLVDQHLLQVFEGGYRVPPHLLEALREKARRAWGGARCEHLHRQAAAELRTANQLEPALAHALLGHDWEATMQIATQVFPRWRFDQHQGDIQDVLAQIPKAESAEHAFWSLWEGHIASWRGDHARASVHYQEAARLSATQGDASGRFKALYRCLYVALIQQDGPRVEQLRAEALPFLPEAEPEDRADWALAAAFLAEHQGDLAGMHSHNRAVLEVPIAGSFEVAASHTIALLNLHTHALQTGDLAAAGRWIAQALALAGTWSLTAYGVYAAVLSAHLALVQGELDTAGAEFRALPPDWPRRLDWHDRACARVMQAAWQQAEGAFKEADEALKEARRLFSAADFAQGLNLVDERAAWLAIARQQPEQALEATQRHDDSELNLYQAALLLPRARALLALQRPSEALAVLSEAEAAYARLGARLHQARTTLLQAAAQSAMNEVTQATQRLETQKQAWLDAGWSFLLREDPALWDMLEPTRLGAPVSAAAGLTIRLLGSFEVLRDGARVTHWERRRSQIVLAALALYPRGLNLSELADVLGEDEVAESKWRVTVSYLRQALEPGLARGRSSRFIQMTQDRYQLVPEQVESLDVRLFEAAIQRARHSRSLDPMAAASHYQAALALHQGELLADPFFAAYFEPIRQELRLQAIEALLWLLQWCSDRRDEASAQDLVKRAMELAADEEEVALTAQAYWLARQDKTRAAQVYWDHRKACQLRSGSPAAASVEQIHRQSLQTAFPCRGSFTRT